MTNLTEQWKKGELPSGWYYVRLIRGEHHIDLYINSKNEWIDCPDNIIDTVVCEVPSYEEWDKLNNACHELEKETACMTVDLVMLKELLKGNKSLNEAVISTFGWLKTIITPSQRDMCQKVVTLTTELNEKIDEVLGEE